MSDSTFFSWRKAILKSALPPTTRHVLLTIGCHMNDAGESCFPSIKLLCEETGLSNRAVITHIHNATELGWITVGRHGFAGQKWAAHEYRPAWPHNLRNAADSLEKAVNEVHDLSKKAVNVIPKAVNVIPKAVKEVHSSTPESTPESTSLNTITPPKKSSSENLLSDIDPQIASDYLAIRKAKNLPLTKTALNAIQREAAKLDYSLEQALTICCEHSWGGFQAAWVLKEQLSGKSPNSLQQENKESTMRAKARLFGSPTEKDVTNETTRL